MKAPDDAVAALAARQHWAFTRRQAIEIGLSASACDRRLRSGEWCRAWCAGVYRLSGQPQSWHQRLMVAILASPSSTVASHRSASVLHGLREGVPIEVMVPAGAHRRLARGHSHQGQLNRRDRVTVHGIPTTGVDRTLVDLAAVVDDRALEQAVEAAIRLGLTTQERVQARLDELATPGRHGVARLRAVLNGRPEGRAAGSPMEVRVIQLLRDAGLGHAVRQHEVVVGDRRYFLDVAYPERRLAIELDGEGHHGGAQFQRDRTPQNALVLAGWTVLRFTWADVMERPGDVIAAVTLAMAA